MQVKLTVQERMKDLRVARGLTLEQLAAETGLSKSALGNYEENEQKDISPYSIEVLADYYGVSPDYLTGRTEIKNRPNAELHELHLSEGAMDILKNGTINNRLLCELMTHPDFRRLMIDMEIYIDRIADMRIKDMNAILAAVRQELIEKHQPVENDLYVRTLELAQIEESEFFTHTIHNELDSILRDIREDHKKDSTTADEGTSAEQVRQNLTDAISYKGTEQEKQAKVFCRQLGIDYDKLTSEEFTTLIGILKKSSYLKSAYNNRGKGKGKGKGKK